MGGWAGRRAVERRDRPDDRKQDAAGPRRVGRREGRQDEIGERDRVPESERPAAETLHQREGDPVSEPRLLIPDREHEHDEHQPHRAVRESRQRPPDRGRWIGGHEAQQRRQRHPQQSDHGAGDRLGDEGRNRRDEQREEVPRVGRQAGRGRNHHDARAERKRHDRPPQDRRHRRGRLGGHGHGGYSTRPLHGAAAPAATPAWRTRPTLCGTPPR